MIWISWTRTERPQSRTHTDVTTYRAVNGTESGPFCTRLTCRSFETHDDPWSSNAYKSRNHRSWFGGIVTIIYQCLILSFTFQQSLNSMRFANPQRARQQRPQDSAHVSESIQLNYFGNPHYLNTTLLKIIISNLQCSFVFMVKILCDW